MTTDKPATRTRDRRSGVRLIFESTSRGAGGLRLFVYCLLRPPSNRARIQGLGGRKRALSPSLPATAAWWRLRSAYCLSPEDRVEEGEIRHRLAIDIGGTFTDLAAVDVATGELVVTKAPT